VSRLRRPILHSRFFFVTTNLRKGLRSFNDKEFDMLAHSLLRVRELVPVAICAYCFMPDHVHAILFPQEQTTISDVMMRFKVASSRRIRPLRGRAFWQARFYDRVLRSRGEYDETYEYIHSNPVRAGLAQDPLGWEWSSARWFAERAGPIAMDDIRLPFDPQNWI
jgi:REP element-mobilizing transposase RayT